jgi:hypothetical protein
MLKQFATISQDAYPLHLRLENRKRETRQKGLLLLVVLSLHRLRHWWFSRRTKKEKKESCPLQLPSALMMCQGFFGIVSSFLVTGRCS